MTNEPEKTILVVEDDANLREAIRIALEKNGFRALLVSDLSGALAKLHAPEDLAAVWLDYYLSPKETGLDFITHWRSHDRARRIPIFVVANTADPDAARACIKLGAVKHYIKAENRLDDIVQDIRARLELS